MSPARASWRSRCASCPPTRTRRLEIGHRIEEMVRAEGQIPLGSREVPVDPSQCGRVAHEAMPTIRQLMIRRGPDTPDADSFERKLFVIRRTIELETSEVTFPSFSARTIVYKGMLTAPQLARFYPDLRDPLMKSALAIVHSRFSTNTFPSWGLAHPHRMSAHNGEINTLQGNVNWMQAREAILQLRALRRRPRSAACRWSPRAPPTRSRSTTSSSSSASAGHSLPHAAMMMIPRAHENRDGVPPELEGFYHYHSRLIEPWDGPAAITFTDGKFLGATLDRNGLRPGRWLITHDGWVAVSSEAGSFQVPDENVAYRGRLRPGSHVRGRPRAGPRPRRGRGRERRRQLGAVGRVGRRPLDPPGGPAAGEPRRARPRPPPRSSSATSSRSASRKRTSASFSRPWRATPRSRRARWGTTWRSPCSPSRRRPSSATSSSASLR